MAVCGEPCAQQICRFCTVDNTPDSITDLVMHTSLGKLEENPTLDSMTITLPCQHLFTVETLDNVTRLGDFYEKDRDGNWTKAVTPELSGQIRKRPVCPTCGGSINSLRYGRAYKSSDAAIMQRDNASRLSRLLASTDIELASVRASLKASVVSAATACPPADDVTGISGIPRWQIRNKLESALSREVDCPTPVEVIQNPNKFHEYTQQDSDLWRAAVSAILGPYQVARQIATDRDKSFEAYSTSLATVYQEELGRLVDDPAHVEPQDVEQLALRLARMRIGQPPHASLRFIIEAFWVTIDILVLLGLATYEASKAIGRREPNTRSSLRWTKLAEFFLNQAVKDAEVALKLAESSESWNKVIICQLILLRTKYELALHKCRSSVNPKGNLYTNARASTKKMCEDGILMVQQQQSTVPEDYLQQYEDRERDVRRSWVNENFTQPSNAILRSWMELKKSTESGGRYNEVTDEERAAILKIRTRGSSKEVGFGKSESYACI